jgi:hypothetical protein
MRMSVARDVMPYKLANAPETALSGQFGVAAFAPENVQNAANTNAAILADTNTSTEETDSLDLLAPTTISWEQQVISKLEAGLEGEAYNLIMTKLDGRSLDYVTEKLSEFMNEFSERGYDDLANDLGNILQMLSYDSIGLDYDFMASRQNAADAAEEMKKHHRHPVERHFQNELYKPHQFVQPFLGYNFG